MVLVTAGVPYLGNHVSAFAPLGLRFCRFLMRMCAGSNSGSTSDSCFVFLAFRSPGETGSAPGSVQSLYSISVSMSGTIGVGLDNTLYINVSRPCVSAVACAIVLASHTSGTSCSTVVY